MLGSLRSVIKAAAAILHPPSFSRAPVCSQKGLGNKTARVHTSAVASSPSTLQPTLTHSPPWAQALNSSKRHAAARLEKRQREAANRRAGFL